MDLNYPRIDWTRVSLLRSRLYREENDLHDILLWSFSVNLPRWANGELWLPWPSLLFSTELCDKSVTISTSFVLRWLNLRCNLKLFAPPELMRESTISLELHKTRESADLRLSSSSLEFIVTTTGVCWSPTASLCTSSSGSFAVKCRIRRCLFVFPFPPKATAITKRRGTKRRIIKFSTEKLLRLFFHSSITHSIGGAIYSFHTVLEERTNAPGEGLEY